MKKLFQKLFQPLIWLCLGAGLMLAGQAAADTVSLTGKTVAGEKDLRVNGSDVGSVIIVDNKSFAEVRALANAAGMSVSYDKTGVDLSSMAAPEQLQYLHTQADLLTNQIAELNKQIDNINNVLIPAQQAKIDAPGRDSTKQLAQKTIDMYKADLQTKKSQIAQLQGQLDTINAQITELEAAQTTPDPTPTPTPTPDPTQSPDPSPSPSPTDSAPAQ